LQLQPAKEHGASSQQGASSQLQLYRGGSLSHCVADATCNVLHSFITPEVHSKLCEISNGATYMNHFFHQAAAVLAGCNLGVVVEFKQLGDDGRRSKLHAEGERRHDEGKLHTALKEQSHCGSVRYFVASPACWSGPPTHAVGIRGCAGAGAVVFDSHSSDKPIPFVKFFASWPKKVKFLREVVVRPKQRPKQRPKKRKRGAVAGPKLHPGDAASQCGSAFVGV
jgi:hypothetical protein